MRCLVLGSSGQIGHSLCEYLSENGHEAFEFDILNNDSEDLRIPRNHSLDQCLRISDFVFFLAFDIGGSNYIRKYQNTYDFLDNNSRIMVNTFELLKKHKTPFLFASSTMADNALSSSYGCLKTLGEYYTRSLNGLSAKFWNVYGVDKHPDTERNHVVCDFIQKARSTGVIDMMTDGSEVRQFLHSEDCSSAMEAIMLSYDQIDRDKPIHVTNGIWSSISDVADIVSSIIPSTVTKGENRDEVHGGIMNEPDPYILEFWKPKISLKAGIQRICDYYESNSE